MPRLTFIRVSLLVMSASLIAFPSSQFSIVIAVYSEPVPDPQNSEAAVALASRAVAHEPGLEADQKRFDEIKALLEAIPTGREALQLVEEHQVQLEFRPGKGTYYNWSDNTVVVDSNRDSISAVFSLAHEITHASHYHRGRWTRLSALSRQEFIEQLVAEEAEAGVRAIEAKLELEAVGVPVSVKAAALEDSYLEGYKAALTTAGAAESDLTEAELTAVGQEAGKQAIIEGYMNGLTVSSHNFETYPAMLGKHWDKINQAAATSNANSKYFLGKRGDCRGC